MLNIGLTGGIGSGKSVVGQFFTDIGIITIDADRVSRQITSPGTPLFEDILCHFGPKILFDNGHLDRKKIRNIIFNNPDEKSWLEQLLHPAIHSVMVEQIQVTKAPYIIMIIPLLVELNKIDLIDRVLLIDAEESLQIERASSRDNISREDVMSIIKAQSSRIERIAQADDIIINNGNLKDLQQKVLSMHKYYLTLCEESEK